MFILAKLRSEKKCFSLSLMFFEVNNKNFTLLYESLRLLFNALASMLNTLLDHRII